VSAALFCLPCLAGHSPAAWQHVLQPASLQLTPRAQLDVLKPVPPEVMLDSVTAFWPALDSHHHANETVRDARQHCAAVRPGLADADHRCADIHQAGDQAGGCLYMLPAAQHADRARTLACLTCALPQRHRRPQTLILSACTWSQLKSYSLIIAVMFVEKQQHCSWTEQQNLAREHASRPYLLNKYTTQPEVYNNGGHTKCAARSEGFLSAQVCR